MASPVETPIKVLIVDDEAGVRELLKDALKEVEVEYELKVELETQTKFGNSWAEVH